MSNAFDFTGFTCGFVFYQLCVSPQSVLVASFINQMCVSPQSVLVASFLEVCVSPLRVYLWHRLFIRCV